MSNINYFNRLAGGLALLFLVILPGELFSQHLKEVSATNSKGISVELFVGVEHTTLRHQVLYKENLSPYLNIAVGKQLTSFLTLSLGYHGPYFNYLGDSGGERHNYFYVDASAIVEANNLLKFWEDKRVRFNILLGTGVMGNMYAKKANWCLTGAFVPEFKINSDYSIKLKVGGIGGWGIYQDNEDALVSLSLGLTRYF